MLQEFAKQKGLLPQPMGARIVRKQVAQFIAEHRCTAGFQYNDGQTRLNLERERLQDVLQILFGLLQHSKVVEWTAAAKMRLRHHHVESCVRKNFQGSL